MGAEADKEADHDPAEATIPGDPAPAAAIATVRATETVQAVEQVSKDSQR